MKKRKWLWLILGISVGVIAATSIVYYLHRPPDVKTALRVALNVPEERKDYFFLNIPPLADCYPGTMYSALGTPIGAVASSSPDLSRGPLTQFRAHQKVDARLRQSVTSSLLSGVLQQQDLGDVTIDIHGLTVVTMDSSRIKRRLLQSDEALDLYNHGKDPLVVLKSYEGIVELTMHNTSQTSAKGNEPAQDKTEILRSRGFTVQGAVEGSGSHDMRMTSNAPIVFAYEAAHAKFATSNLGPRPDTVEFTPVREKETMPSLASLVQN